MERFISTEVINSKVKNRKPGNLALYTARAPPAAHSGSSMQESSWMWTTSFPARYKYFSAMWEGK